MSKIYFKIPLVLPAYIHQNILDLANAFSVKVKCTTDGNHYAFTFSSENIYFFIQFLTRLSSLILYWPPHILKPIFTKEKK